MKRLFQLSLFHLEIKNELFSNETSMVQTSQK
jgi:hypothetical protein